MLLFLALLIATAGSLSQAAQPSNIYRSPIQLLDPALSESLGDHEEERQATYPPVELLDEEEDDEEVEKELEEQLEKEMNEADEDRIIDGLSTGTTFKFPHQAMVLSGGSLCGGSLISNRAVLTAAHCVTNGGSVTIRLGVGSSRHQVIQGVATRHPSYTGNPGIPFFDIAIVNLATPATFSVFVRPATVGQFPDEMNKFLWISGYGTIALHPVTGARTLPGNRLHFGLNRVTRIFTSSQPQFIGLSDPFDNTPPVTAACFGDSGGPASVFRGINFWPFYLRYEVIGVTSFLFGGSNGQAQCGGTGPGGPFATDLRSYYTRTSQFKSFIQSTAQGTVVFT